MDICINKCLCCLVYNTNIRNVLSPDNDGIIIGIKLNYALHEEKITMFYNKIVNYKPYAPKHICVDCLEDLNNVYKFKQKCLKNLKTLSNYVEQIEKGQIIEIVDEKQDNEIENIEIKIEPELIQFNAETENLEEQTNNLNAENIINEDPTNELQEKDIKENMDIKIEPEQIQNNSYNLEAMPQNNNLEEILVKGEPTNIHDQTDIKDESTLPRENYKKHELENDGSNSGLIPTSTSIMDEDSNNKQYECDVCNRIFHRNFILRQHKKIHTREKPYECDLCNSSFSQKCNMMKHRRLHTGEKPYECEICHKAFYETSSLAVHRRQHTGEKPYECDVCDKSFKQLWHLKRHKQYHNDERPYQCELCPYRSRCRNDLKSHVQRKHIKKETY